MNDLTTISWPISEASETVQSLCQHIGMSSSDLSTIKNASVDQAARELGVEAEPMGGSYQQVDQLILGSAPSILRFENNGEPRLLALLAGNRKTVSVLSPDRQIRQLPIEQVSRVLCEQIESTVEPTIDRVTTAVRGRVLKNQTRKKLLQELLASTRIDAGWLIRTSPAVSLWSQARELKLQRLLGLLLGSHTIFYVLWIVSWWLLGSSVLQGRQDLGWLVAWCLMIFTLIPFRVLVTYFAGTFSIRASVLIKRRLLFGSLQLEPEKVRRLGSGHLLGRILETEVLDSMALSGGFLSLTAVIEMIAAAFILAFGAGGIFHVLFLFAMIATTIFIARSHYQIRKQWTTQRLDMTDGLVEKMDGHRTRLVQQPADDWNSGEDQELSNYLSQSSKLDRTVQLLKVLIPQGWLVVGLVGFSGAFIFGDPSSTTLAISIGGILVAHGAFRNLTEGMDRLAGAVIAWNRIKLFSDAAKTEDERHFAALPDGAVNGHATVISAKDLVFRYPNRKSEILDDTNLTIRKGDQILLQGRSGGGKSTLGSLLSGLRIPNSGLILYRGLDLKSLGKYEWRRRIALAPQFHENHVLMGTFAFNLLMGRRWPPLPEDLKEAQAVCAELGLQPLLDRMPGGLEQIVGETGWQLSQGEASRLFLARAILQQAEVLILDESFGALDPETLRKSLQYVIQKVPTLLLIAHP